MDFFSVLSHLDWSQVGQLTLQHLLLVLVAVGLAILVGVPLGVLMTRFTWLAGPLQGAATVMLTIPSIALFGLLMPVYSVFGQGLGPLPAITAVFLYSLLPILRNTYLALTGVEAGIREAGKGIGMTFWQRLRMVDIPRGAGDPRRRTHRRGDEHRRDDHRRGDRRRRPGRADPHFHQPEQHADAGGRRGTGQPPGHRRRPAAAMAATHPHPHGLRASAHDRSRT